MNKYWLSGFVSMDYTHSHPSTIASLSCAAQLSPVPYTHHNFLKTAIIPTYYGISIDIPRYTAMQLSIIPFIMTHSSLSYCLAWSCSWHSICGKATVHNSFIHVTLGSLHIPVHHRRHSYRVIFVLVSSCIHWVVNKKKCDDHHYYRIVPSEE